MISIEDAKKENEALKDAVQALNDAIIKATHKGLRVTLVVTQLTQIGHPVTELVEAIVYISPDELEC